MASTWYKLLVCYESMSEDARKKVVFLPISKEDERLDAADRDSEEATGGWTAVRGFIHTDLLSMDPEFIEFKTWACLLEDVVEFVYVFCTFSTKMKLLHSQQLEHRCNWYKSDFHTNPRKKLLASDRLLDCSEDLPGIASDPCPWPREQVQMRPQLPGGSAETAHAYMAFCRARAEGSVSGGQMGAEGGAG
ncbi:hypothetical protein GGX14DRAFT_388340 [Mycena pura]|uniref:Uncharacterized protein n=1 Tax=Mycena pura TaxID=153505 RepID=A0AAD7E1N5_9AGAR|nr:hypothetical protein GGX14DRAFT_388340 [Mycena pura]